MKPNRVFKHIKPITQLNSPPETQYPTLRKQRNHHKASEGVFMSSSEEDEPQIPHESEDPAPTSAKKQPAKSATKEKKGESAKKKSEKPSKSSLKKSKGKKPTPASDEPELMEVTRRQAGIKKVKIVDNKKDKASKSSKKKPQPNDDDFEPSDNDENEEDEDDLDGLVAENEEISDVAESEGEEWYDTSNVLDPAINVEKKPTRPGIPKRSAQWSQIAGTKVPDLPKITSNRGGGPLIHIPEGCADPETYRAKFVEELTPHKSFQLFFPDEMYDLILDQTVLYVKQQMDKGVFSRKEHNWKYITLRDVKNFVGMTLWMCIVKVPQVKHHFCSDVIYQNSMNKIMSGKKFILVNSSFHLADNSRSNKLDPLFKIRPLVDVLEKRFAEYYEPSDNVTIDEAMVKFTGQVYFKQLMKGKPVKWGIKLFLMCDSRNGYCHSFKVYTGRRDSMDIESWKQTEAYLKLLRERREKDEARKREIQEKKEEILRRRFDRREEDHRKKQLREEQRRQKEEMRLKLLEQAKQRKEEKKQGHDVQIVGKRRGRPKKFGGAIDKPLFLYAPYRECQRIWKRKKDGTVTCIDIRPGKDAPYTDEYYIDEIDVDMPEPNGPDAFVEYANNGAFIKDNELFQEMAIVISSEEEMEVKEEELDIDRLEAKQKSKQRAVAARKYEKKKAKVLFEDDCDILTDEVLEELEQEEESDDDFIDATKLEWDEDRLKSIATWCFNVKKEEYMEDIVKQEYIAPFIQVKHEEPYLPISRITAPPQIADPFDKTLTMPDIQLPEGVTHDSLVMPDNLTTSANILAKPTQAISTVPATDPTNKNTPNETQTASHQPQTTNSEQVQVPSSATSELDGAKSSISKPLSKPTNPRKFYANTHVPPVVNKYQLSTPGHDASEVESVRPNDSETQSIKPEIPKASQQSDSNFEKIASSPALMQIESSLKREEIGTNKPTEQESDVKAKLPKPESIRTISSARGKSLFGHDFIQKMEDIPNLKDEADIWPPRENWDHKLKKFEKYSTNKPSAQPGEYPQTPSQSVVTASAQAAIEDAQQILSSLKIQIEPKKDHFDLDEPKSNSIEGKIIEISTNKTQKVETKHNFESLLEEERKFSKLRGDEKEEQAKEPPWPNVDSEWAYEEPIQPLEDEKPPVPGTQGYEVDMVGGEMVARTAIENKKPNQRSSRTFENSQHNPRRRKREHIQKDEPFFSTRKRGKETKIEPKLANEEFISDDEMPLPKKVELEELRDFRRINVLFPKRAKPQDTLTQFVVDTLIHKWEHKNFTIYMDNFYTSVGLVADLFDRGKKVCGTIRANRIQGVPAYERPDRGEFIFFRNKDYPEMLLLLFSDSKPVWVLSTNHAPLYTDLGPLGRKRIGRSNLPHMIEDYNHHTHGVDMCNGETARYRYPHRTRKWWKSLFFYFLKLALHNAFVYYAQLTGKRGTLLQFMEEVVQGIIPAADHKVDRSLAHMPQFIHPEGKPVGICVRKACERRTQYMCPGCSRSYKNIALCVPKCFEEYHMHKFMQHRDS